VHTLTQNVPDDIFYENAEFLYAPFYFSLSPDHDAEKDNQIFWAGADARTLA
jgi:hypothetical protein